MLADFFLLGIWSEYCSFLKEPVDCMIWFEVLRFIIEGHDYSPVVQLARIVGRETTLVFRIVWMRIMESVSVHLTVVASVRIDRFTRQNWITIETCSEKFS